jgi:hypothetical protein
MARGGSVWVGAHAHVRVCACMHALTICPSNFNQDNNKCEDIYMKYSGRGRTVGIRGGQQI